MVNNHIVDNSIFSLFLIVHRSGFTFGNAMMYHLYNFIGGLMALFIVLIFSTNINMFSRTHVKWVNGFNTSVATHWLYICCITFLATKFTIHRQLFMQHSNPTLELFITMGIAILVIIISLITNAMICTSPF